MGKIDPAMEALKQAQEVDGKLYDTEQLLKEIPLERAKNKAAMESEKARLNELQENFKKLQLTQKEKEKDLASKEANIKKLDGQLGQVKTNKEYSALQQEIASLKADNSLIEEEVIKVLDEVEAVNGEIKKEQERFKECEKKYQAREQELNEKEKSVKASCDGLRKQHEEVAGKLSPDIKDLYLRILHKKQGHALAQVKGEVCSACQMRLRPQLLNEIMLRQSLVLCENCSRILYIDQSLIEKS